MVVNQSVEPEAPETGKRTVTIFYAVEDGLREDDSPGITVELKLELPITRRLGDEIGLEGWIDKDSTPDDLWTYHNFEEGQAAFLNALCTVTGVSAIRTTRYSIEAEIGKLFAPMDVLTRVLDVLGNLFGDETEVLFEEIVFEGADDDEDDELEETLDELEEKMEEVAEAATPSAGPEPPKSK